jgi:hypothetical protein
MQRVRNKSKAKRTEKSKHETLARHPFRYILLQQKQNHHKAGTRNLHSFDLQHPQAKHISQAKAPNQSGMSIIYSPQFCPPPLSKPLFSTFPLSSPSILSNLTQNNPNRRSLPSPHLRPSQPPDCLYSPITSINHTSSLRPPPIPLFLYLCETPSFTFLFFFACSCTSQFFNQLIRRRRGRDEKRFGDEFGGGISRGRDKFPDFCAEEDVDACVMFWIQQLHAWEGRGGCGDGFGLCCFLGCGC